MDLILGNMFTLNLTADAQVIPLNNGPGEFLMGTSGMSIVLQVTQSGAWDLTWDPAFFEWPYQIAPVNTKVTGEVDYFFFIRSANGSLHGSWSLGYIA